MVAGLPHSVQFFMMFSGIVLDTSPQSTKLFVFDSSNALPVVVHYFRRLLALVESLCQCCKALSDCKVLVALHGIVLEIVDDDGQFANFHDCSPGFVLLTPTRSTNQ